MEDDKRITGIFFTGIVLSSFVISPDVLDFTLIARFISLSLFLFLAFIMLYRKAPAMAVKADLVLCAYALYVLFACSSMLWATNFSEALFESSKLLIGFFVFMLTLFALRYQHEVFVERLLKYSILLFFAELVMILIQLGGLHKLDKPSLYQLTGMNGHKNLLSSFLMLNLLFLIKGLLQLKKNWKLLAGIALLLSLLVLFFLRTKAVWLGLGIAGLTYLMVMLFSTIRKKIRMKLNIWLLAGTAILLINLFFLSLLPRIIDKGLDYNQGVKIPGENTASRELDDERLMLWKKTYTLFRQTPVQGVGAGNWQIHYPDAGLDHLWRAEDLNYTFQRPHNDWLWMLSETGLIGFNLFLLFLVPLMAFVLKTAVQAQDDKPLQRRLALYLATIAGYFTAAFFDFPHERIEHTLWITMILAMAFYESRNTIAAHYFFGFRPRKILYLAASAALLFIACTGVLRYQGEYNLRNMYAYKNRNKLNEVINTCKESESFAYTIDPTSVPISWYSGNAKAANSDYAGAQQDLIKAYRLNPYNRNVINDLASSYAFSNQTELAKAYYAKAARISPRFDDPKLNLAAIYIREENYPMALYWLKALNHPSERRSTYEAIVYANLK